MKHIASFETAKKLEAAGFERPMPEIGQFWYVKNGGIRLIAGKRDGEFIVNGSFNGRWRELVFDATTFENWIYAPTATDLLEHEGSNCILWYDKFKQIWECSKCNNYPDSMGETFTANKNAAEAVAEAFLSQSK